MYVRMNRLNLFSTAITLFKSEIFFCQKKFVLEVIVTGCANYLLVLYITLVVFPVLLKCDLIVKGFVTLVTLVPRFEYHLSPVFYPTDAFKETLIHSVY